MKTKIKFITVFVLVIYILPLFPEPSKIISLPILALIAVAVILFGTQPPVTLGEGQNNEATDRSSIWLILISVCVIQLMIVLEWAYLLNHPTSLQWDVFTFLGLILLFGGTIFRIWCIQTLGKNFTVAVKTQSTQQLIKVGPYQIIRHPSYLGAYLAIVGSAVLLHAYCSIAVATIVMFLTYVYRIKVEETALVNHFGNSYEQYQQETKKLIPFVY